MSLVVPAAGGAALVVKRHADRLGDAGVGLSAVLEHARVDRDVVAAAVGEFAVLREDRRLVPGDDHRVVFVVWQAADGLGGGRRTDVDGLDDPVVGGVDDPDLAGGAERGRRGKGEAQGGVGADVRGVRGRKGGVQVQGEPHFGCVLRHRRDDLGDGGGGW